MRRFYNIYRIRVAAFLLFLLLSLSGLSQIKDESAILFYSIKNVSTEWSSVQLEKSNSSEDIQKYLKQNSSSKQEVKDAFLVPTVINLISENTNFIALNNFKDRKKVVHEYKEAREYLLIISLNKFGDLIEYQFHFSQYINGAYRQQKQSSFFIDPGNPNYFNTIKKEVQQIFNGPLGRNQPPIPKIRLDGEIVDNYGKQIYYRSNQDTFVLDGFSSEDDNTPKKYLRYSWRVEKQGEKNAFISDFNFEEGRQVLVLRDSGVYTFYLKVSDGVAWSNDSSSAVTIHILKQSELQLYKNAQYIVQNSLLPNKEKSFLKSKDEIPFYVSNLPLKNSKLNITYVDSRSKNQKYFINANPEISRNRMALRFDDMRANDDSAQFDKLSGILIDTTLLQNPGIINYRLGSNIKPGVHTYTINSEINGLTSNLDTISIAYHEKSALNFSFGLLSYDILKGGEYDSRIRLNAVKFGFRGYITQRMSADLDVLFPNKAQNETFGDSVFSIHSAVIKLNYDLFPFKYSQLISNESFAYLTVFASLQRMIITGKDDTDEMLIGLGIKPRMQLFKQYKGIGSLYLEGEIGFQTYPCINCRQNGEFYDSWFYGVSLVYGFLNY